MLDVITIRKDFPVLERTVHGKPLVYLDNAATSQKPRSVIRALTDYYENYNSNVHRGVHTLSMEATDRYESAREKCAQFIGAPNPKNIIFVRNTTEAINLVARTWAQSEVSEGDEILITELEHHSNLVPWQELAREKGAVIKIIPIKDDWSLDTSNLNNLLTPRTKLVAMTQMSNVLGTITPVADIVKKAHEIGAKVLVDAAQSVPHLPVDVMDLGCDFFAFSGHKMLGPTGIGILYVSTELLESMDPFLYGGEMVLEVTYERATWNETPMRFEAGTPNIADAIALGAAIDYLTELGMENVRQHEIQITNYAMHAFEELSEDLTAFGPSDLDIRGGVLSFNAPAVHPHDLGTILDGDGIAIRTGHHCAMPLVTKMGLGATARASFYVYNTESEIDSLVASLKQALRFFKTKT